MPFGLGRTELAMNPDRDAEVLVFDLAA